MITATIRPDGTATIDLPGKPIRITEASAAAARRKAVDVLTDYARGYQRLDVAAVDVDGQYQLVFSPDGNVLSSGPFGTATSGTATASGNPAVPISTATGQRGTIDIDVPRFTSPRADDSDAAVTAPPVAATPAFATQRPPAWIPAPPQRLMPAHRAELIFAGGETAAVTEAAILGRRPTAETEGQQLITVADGGRSVSRSHARLAWEGGRLLLSDLHSANGTTISRHGQLLILDAEAPAPVESGDTVSLGDVPITVNITQALGR